MASFSQEMEHLGSVFLKYCGVPSVCIPAQMRNNSTLSQLLELHGLIGDEITFYCNGKIVNNESILVCDSVIYAVPGLLGGKGGFGSMLRAIGAQIEKTTNREACRDLSGRRLRDINEEKRLKKWLSKQQEREHEEAARRTAKYEQLNSKPKHDFVDKDYDKARSEITDKIHNSVSYGLNKTSLEVVKKRPATDEPSTSSTKRVFLMDLGDEDLSSSGEEDSSDASPEQCIDFGNFCKEEPTSSSNDIAITEEKEKHNVGESEINAQAIAVSKEFENCEVLESSSPIITTSGTQDCSDAGKNTSLKELSDSVELDLEAIKTVKELEEFGLDKLKNELLKKGMKCGGSLQERAFRLFSVRGIPLDKIDSSLLSKTKRR